MKYSLAIFLTIFLSLKSLASEENRSFYEGRAEFIKKYIKDIKAQQKINKKYKGTVVESLSGSFFTSIGTSSQPELDNLALNECKQKEEVECKVRFRSLRLNKDYNRYAVYDYKKKSLKVLNTYIKSKKVYTTRGITILKNEVNYLNKKNNFKCTKSTSDFRNILKILLKEIEIYPVSFIKMSGLKFVMICQNLELENSNPLGLAPGHYDQSPGVFYININGINKSTDIKSKKEIIRHLFHHEFYHVIDTALSTVGIDDQWSRLNKQAYSENSTAEGPFINNSVEGFISSYARNNHAEDKAELFAFMITKHNEFKKILPKDEILFNKSKLMIKRLKSLSKNIDNNFWKKLN